MCSDSAAVGNQEHRTPSTDSIPNIGSSSQGTGLDAFANLDRAKRNILSKTCEKLTWLFEVCILYIKNGFLSQSRWYYMYLKTGRTFIDFQSFTVFFVSVCEFNYRMSMCRCCATSRRWPTLHSRQWFLISRVVQCSQAQLRLRRIWLRRHWHILV